MSETSDPVSISEGIDCDCRKLSAGSHGNGEDSAHVIGELDGNLTVDLTLLNHLLTAAGDLEAGLLGNAGKLKSDTGKNAGYLNVVKSAA